MNCWLDAGSLNCWLDVGSLNLLHISPGSRSSPSSGCPRSPSLQSFMIVIKTCTFTETRFFWTNLTMTPCFFPNFFLIAFSASFLGVFLLLCWRNMNPLMQPRGWDWIWSRCRWIWDCYWNRRCGNWIGSGSRIIHILNRSRIIHILDRSRIIHNLNNGTTRP